MAFQPETLAIYTGVLAVPGEIDTSFGIGGKFNINFGNGASASDGSLDSSFGNSGKVNGTNGYAAAILPDGKINVLSLSLSMTIGKIYVK